MSAPQESTAERRLHPVNPVDKPEWYRELPAWSRVMLQLGFAGVIAALFVWSTREQADQLVTLQNEARALAREDRMMFREELKLLREGTDRRVLVITDQLKEMTRGLERAVDAMEATSRSVAPKKDKDDEPPATAPPPKLKPEVIDP